MVVATKPGRGWAVGRSRGNRWKGEGSAVSGHLSGWCLKDVILDHLSDFSAITRDQLGEDLAYDYGSFEIRSLHRNLSALVRDGFVAREEEYDLRMGSMIPVYRRLRRDLPMPRPAGDRMVLAPFHQDPIGPWPGYRVIVAAEHRTCNRPAIDYADGRSRSPWPSAAQLVTGALYGDWRVIGAHRFAVRRVGRQPTARIHDSPQPAGSADRPDRPRRAARRER